MNHHPNNIKSNQVFSLPSNRTLDLDEAAIFLCAHKETIRRMAATGKIPGVKVGRKWIFIEQDLVVYLRSQYSTKATSQGADSRSNKLWHCTKEVKRGGLPSPTMDKEYKEALGLATK